MRHNWHTICILISNTLVHTHLVNLYTLTWKVCWNWYTLVRQIMWIELCAIARYIYTPAQRSWRGVYWIHLVRPLVCPFVRPSIRPSVCRRHGFRSISQVCFGISIPNFICMLMVGIGRSLYIFSDVTFKMAPWRPYWNFWFLNSNFTLALNINFKLQRHNTYVYG